MTKKHWLAIAKVIRDSDAFDSHSSRVQFAREMATALDDTDLSKNFDREMFMAYATSVVPE